MDHVVIKAQQFEKEKHEERLRVIKRYRLEDDDSSQKGPYGQSSSNNPYMCKHREVSTLICKEVTFSRSYLIILIRPTCTRCGEKKYGKCLADKKDDYGCGSTNQKKKEFLVHANRGKGRKKIRSWILRSLS